MKEDFEGISAKRVMELYRDFCGNETQVRVAKGTEFFERSGEEPSLWMAVVVSENSDFVVAAAFFDNLGTGSAGSLTTNARLMLEEGQ